MSTLTVETARDGQVRPLAFTRDPAPLLGLMAFGVAEPFGSQHPLTILVRRLKREHGLDVAPLLTYYDRAVRDAEDREKLAAAWQDAATRIMEDAGFVPLTESKQTIYHAARVRNCAFHSLSFNCDITAVWLDGNR